MPLTGRFHVAPDVAHAQFKTKAIFGENQDSSTGGQIRREDRTTLQRIRQEGIVIYPHGSFRAGWDLTSILLICWIAIFLPARLAYDVGNEVANCLECELVPMAAITIFMLIDTWVRSTLSVGRLYCD